MLDGGLRRIVLTQWHEDHTGSAADLAARYGAEVVAQRVEAAGASPVLEESEIPIRAGVPAGWTGRWRTGTCRGSAVGR